MTRLDIINKLIIKNNYENYLEIGVFRGEVLNNCVGSLIQIADLLVPFLPDTATMIHQTFQSGAIVNIEGVAFPKIYKHTTDPNAPKV